MEREIPILFKDNWYLEKGIFNLGRPKDAASRPRLTNK